MPITLQSTVGGFSAEFMRKLPELEQAMIAHGLEPSQFVISKDRATPPAVPFIGPFFYDYTVFIGDESFTVTEPNDIRFLEYFYQRCIAEDEAARRAAQRAPRPDQPHLPLDGAADLTSVALSAYRTPQPVTASADARPTPPTAAPASPARSLRNSARP